MRKGLFILCVMVSASCCIYTAVWLFAGQRQKEADRAIADLFQLAAHQSAQENKSGDMDTDNIAGKNSAAFDELLTINPDVVGWLKIDGTSINHPVVQNSDNAYYLSHDLYNKPNKHGAIFMDYRCEWNGNKIIYGHHMKDGTMFHDLTRYKDEAFRRDHDTVLLYNTQGICEVYRIVDVLYRATSFSSQKLSLYEYLGQSKDDYTEKPLLYLITCDGSAAGARLIVVAGKEFDNK